MPHPEPTTLDHAGGVKRSAAEMTTATLTADWMAYAEVCTRFAPALHPLCTLWRALCSGPADAQRTVRVHRSTAATGLPPAAARWRSASPTPRRAARRNHATSPTRARHPAGRSRSPPCRLSRHRMAQTWTRSVQRSGRAWHGATSPCGLHDVWPLLPTYFMGPAFRSIATRSGGAVGCAREFTGLSLLSLSVFLSVVNRSSSSANNTAARPCSALPPSPKSGRRARVVCDRLCVDISVYKF